MPWKGDCKYGRLAEGPNLGSRLAVVIAWPVPGHAGDTALSPCAAVGDRGGAPLCATARAVCSVRGRPCRVAAVG